MTKALVMMGLIFLIISQTGIQTWAQADFIDVGDRPVTLGKLTFRPPAGWVRAPEEVEKSENAYMLGYRGNKDGSDDLSLILSIARQSDAFQNEPQRKAFLKKTGQSLAKQGWKPKNIRVAEVDIPAFETTSDEGERLVLAMVPVKGRFYRFFFVLSKPAVGLPEPGRQLLARVLAPDDQPAVSPPTDDQPIVARPHVPPGIEEIEISNIFYTGDIDDTTPMGARTRQWQEEILSAAVDACRMFDTAYDHLRAANAGFDATVFDLHQRMKNARVDPQVIRQEEKILSRLAELMALQTGLDAGIREIRRQIRELNQPLGRSLLGGHLQLTLLDLYTRAGQIQTTRSAEIFSFYTAFHQTDLSPLDSRLRKKYSKLIEKEEKALIAALQADYEMQTAERAVARSLTGLKDIYRLSLDLNLEFLEAGVWELENKIRSWAPTAQYKVEAKAAGDALFLLRSQMQDLKQAKALLDQAAENWPGRIANQKNSQYLSTPGTIVLAAFSRNLQPVIPYTLIAQKTGSALSNGDQMAHNYASAVRSDVQSSHQNEGFFGKMYRGVRNTVGAAANSFSMATKLAADKYYAYSEGLSEKDARDIARQSVREHMAEWDQGEVGRGAMRRAIQGFEHVENTAEKTVEKKTAQIFGRGWTSWAAGKLANAATSTFTGLGKGVMQLSAHDATTGERVEGVINVASSLIGLSKSATKPLTQSAGTAVKTVAGQTGKTITTITSNRATIAVEREIIATMKETGTEIAQKNIATANQAMVTSLEKLRQAVTTSFEGMKKGAGDMMTGQGFTQEAKKALTNLTPKDTFKNTIKTMAENLSPNNLPFGAIDNALAAESRQAVNTLTAENQTPEQKAHDEREQRKKRKEKQAQKEKDTPPTDVDVSNNDQPDQNEDQPNPDDETDEETKSAQNEADSDTDTDQPQPDQEQPANPGLLDIVAPQRVKAAGVFYVPTPAGGGKMENVEVKVSVTFWNVGTQGGPAYSGATFTYIATNRGATETNRITGHFTGGPNGAIQLPEITLSVHDGATVSIPEMGSVPIQNPGAFADWP